MRIRSSRLLTGLAGGAVVALTLAPPAQADGDDDVTVHPGESIQMAIDEAEEGTTIHIEEGTYTEALLITTDGIELRGHDAVLMPPADSESACLFDPGAGVCIQGELDFETFEVVDPVRDVSISGITVEGAAGSGLIGIATEELEVEESHFVGNGGYGAASFITDDTTFEDNVARDNGEAGFYVGDSPESDAKVKDNESTGNEMGFFFRNASHGTAADNVATGNCLGMLVLAGAPGPAVDWNLAENTVNENNKACAGTPEGEPPPLSGAGIVLIGAQEFEVEDNEVMGNDSAEPSFVKGGIVVMTSPFAPGFAPSGSIEDNEAFDNAPADIVWDSTGDVVFEDNDCATSDPDGLCDEDD